MLPWIYNQHSQFCNRIGFQIRRGIVQIPCLAIRIFQNLEWHVLIWERTIVLFNFPLASTTWALFLWSLLCWLYSIYRDLDQYWTTINNIYGLVVPRDLIVTKSYWISKRAKFKDFSTFFSMYLEPWSLTKLVEPNCSTPRGSTGIIAIVCTRSILNEFRKHTSGYIIYYSTSKFCSPECPLWTDCSSQQWPMKSETWCKISITM